MNDVSLCTAGKGTRAKGGVELCLALFGFLLMVFFVATPVSALDIAGGPGGTGAAGGTGGQGNKGGQGGEGGKGANATSGTNGGPAEDGFPPVGINDGVDGAAGTDGVHGVDGVNGKTAGVAGVAGDEGASGANGTDGAPGLLGTQAGRVLNGTITEAVTITGGNGGRGGAGGAGGTGGTGGDGGDGGEGGDAGSGGDGGKGGNGADADAGALSGNMGNGGDGGIGGLGGNGGNGDKGGMGGTGGNGGTGGDGGIGGVGGAGGNAAVTVGSDVTFTSTLSIAGGTGGNPDTNVSPAGADGNTGYSGGTGSEGMQGSDGTVGDYGTNGKDDGIYRGGAGGAGGLNGYAGQAGEGGAGGAGGEGGAGGAGGQGGMGGRGGDAIFDGGAHTVTVQGDLTILGGGPGSTALQHETAGGGDARVTAAQLNFEQDVSVATNNSGYDGGGRASLHVKNLVAQGTAAQTITLNDTNQNYLSVLIETLTVANDLTVTLQSTQAWSDTSTTGVFLGNLVFDEGKILAVNGLGAHDYTAAGNITVRGKGAVFNNATTVGYDARGKALTFYVDDVNQDDVMLSAGGQAIRVNGATVGLQLTQDGRFGTWIAGDRIVLIDNVDGETATTQTSTYGSAIRYSFLVGNEQLGSATGLVATFQGETVDDEISREYLEGSTLVRLSALNTRFDLAPSGMRCRNGWFGVGAATGFTGDQKSTLGRYDLDIFNLAAGIGHGRVYDNFCVAGTLFVEYGRGEYKHYHQGAVRGKGNTDYIGGGIAGRMDFTNGLHLSAAVSAGRAGSDLTIDGGDMPGDIFDTSSTYVGGYISVGKIFELTQRASIDLSGSVFYTRLSKDTTTTSYSERFRVCSAESLRTRLHARFSYNLTGGLEAFTGAAWEREFKGKARGTVDEYTIQSVKMKGDTGIGELGIRYTSGDGRWLTSASVHSAFGGRQGLGGTVAIICAF